MNEVLADPLMDLIIIITVSLVFGGIVGGLVIYFVHFWKGGKNDRT